MLQGELERNLLRRRCILIISGFTVYATWLIGATAALAAEPVANQLMMQRPAAQIFTFMFLMLGPFKIIGPFSKITTGADRASIRRIAMWATLFSCLALVVAAVLGESFLNKYGIPVP